MPPQRRREKRAKLTAANEDVRHLHHDDGAKTGRRRLGIDGTPRGEWFPVVPSFPVQYEEEGRQSRGGLHRPQPTVGTGEQSAVEQSLLPWTRALPHDL